MSSFCAGKTVAGRQADAAEASKAHGGELWHAHPWLTLSSSAIWIISHKGDKYEVCFRMLQDHSAIPVLYASSWLLTAFASDFPIFFASRVMDIILTDRYVVAIMKVCRCS